MYGNVHVSASCIVISMSYSARSGDAELKMELSLFAALCPKWQL